jgi:hypothetical protein
MHSLLASWCNAWSAALSISCLSNQEIAAEGVVLQQQHTRVHQMFAADDGKWEQMQLIGGVQGWRSAASYSHQGLTRQNQSCAMKGRKEGSDSAVQ